MHQKCTSLHQKSSKWHILLPLQTTEDAYLLGKFNTRYSIVQQATFEAKSVIRRHHSRGEPQKYRNIDFSANCCRLVAWRMANAHVLGQNLGACVAQGGTKWHLNVAPRSKRADSNFLTSSSDSSWKSHTIQRFSLISLKMAVFLSENCGHQCWSAPYFIFDHKMGKFQYFLCGTTTITIYDISIAQLYVICDVLANSDSS